MSVCPECGGTMKFDRHNVMHTCQECGLALSRDDLAQSRKRADGKVESEEERKRKEMLRWWLSSKK